MFFIKYKLKPSKIHRIGIFSDKNIKKGTLVYKHSPELDLQIPKIKFNNINQKDKKLILHLDILINIRRNID